MVESVVNIFTEITVLSTEKKCKKKLSCWTFVFRSCSTHDLGNV